MILTATPDQTTYDDGAPVVLDVTWTIDQTTTTDVVTGTNQDGLPTIVTTVTTDNADTSVVVTDDTGGTWVQTDGTPGHATFSGTAHAGTVTVTADSTSGAHETAAADIVITPPPGYVPQYAGDVAPGTKVIGVSVDTTQTIEGFEVRIDSQVGLVREYYDPNPQGVTIDSVTTAAARYVAAHTAAGRLAVVSFKLPHTDWRGTASGLHDDYLALIKSKLRAAVPDGKSVIVSFHHEPRGDGKPIDFTDMYDLKLLPYFADCASWLTVAPILNGFTATGENLRDWCPKSPLLKLCLYDNYNQWWTSDRTLNHNFRGEVQSFIPWQAPAKALDIAREIISWGLDTGIVEWGCHYDPANPTAGADYVTQMGQQLYDPSLDRLKFVSAFQSAANSPRGGWRFDKYAPAVNRGDGYPKPAVYVTETSRLVAAAAWFNKTAYPNRSELMS